MQIAKGEEISKIVFHQLTAVPTVPRPYKVSTTAYQQQLSKSAAGYHKSFLDVSGIEDRAARKANEAVRNSLVVGGLAVAFLVAWASLEPLASKWLWEKTGVLSSTQRTADAQLLKDLESARALLQSASDVKGLELKAQATQQEVLELRKQIETLTRAVQAVKK